MNNTHERNDNQNEENYDNENILEIQRKRLKKYKEIIKNKARYSKKNINCYLTVFDELFKFQDSLLTQKFAKYTLSKVFYTGHIIPLKDKPAILERALKSGYLKYIGWKNIIVFLFKS